MANPAPSYKAGTGIAKLGENFQVKKKYRKKVEPMVSRVKMREVYIKPPERAPAVRVC